MGKLLIFGGGLIIRTSQNWVTVEMQKKSKENGKIKFQSNVFDPYCFVYNSYFWSSSAGSHNAKPIKNTMKLIAFHLNTNKNIN